MNKLFLTIVLIIASIDFIGAKPSTIDSLEAIIKKETASKKVDAMLKLSQLMYDKNPTNGISIAFDAVTLSKKLPNDILSQSLENLAFLYQKTSNYEASIDYYKQALEKKKTADGVTKIINNMGVFLGEIGKF